MDTPSQNDRLARRLAELKAEHEKGRAALSELDGERAALDAERERVREQLLRISGAIRVLEELTAEQQGGDDGGN